MLRSLLDRLRRSALLTRALFGIRIPAGTAQAHWDLASLALRRALRGELRPGQGVVEVGTGECATLALWLARHHDGPVLALDVSAEAISVARQVVAANRSRVELRQSDLLEAVTPSDAAELVFFNPPFVPTRAGEAAGLPRREPARVWDGGPDGLAVMRRFLEQCARLRPGTTVLLGSMRGRCRDWRSGDCPRAPGWRSSGNGADS
jgi:release factor glutamine methyltransferase